MRYWFSAVLALAGCIEDVPVPDLRSPDAHVFPMDAVVDAGRVTIRDRGSVDFSPMPPPTDAPTTPISADIGPPDASPVDALVDAAPLPVGVTQAQFPWNGFATGSVWATSDTGHPSRRPTFQWTPVEDADYYQLRLDDDCTDNGSCDFPSPERFDFTETRVTLAVDLPVSLVPPVGARYHWSVRACRRGTVSDSVCSTWSATRYLDVGRDRSDYNGDGYGDLVVSAPSHERIDGGRGVHFVYAGSADGVGDEPVTEIRPDVVAETYFPTLANLGDLNGDGYADFAALGSNRGAEGSGDGNAADPRVDIHYGSAMGLASSPSLTLVRDRPCSLRFGVVAVGDLNGDGFGDLAALPDSPTACAQDGRVGDAALIYYGTADGLEAGPRLRVEGPFSSFGTRASRVVRGVGDVDGDGYSDLLLGIGLYTTVRPGLVFRGSAAGLVDRPAYALARPQVLEAARMVFPGQSTPVGDIDGDGFADVVISARQFNAADPPGAILVYRGAPAGPPERPSALVPNLDEAPVFGTRLSAGDLNGDGFRDLAFDTGSQAVGAVRDLTVHFGGAGGLSPEALPVGEGTPNVISSPGDFDGNGVMDLAVSRGRATQATVLLHYGTRDAFSPPRALPTPMDLEPNALFGLVIADSPL